MKMERQPVDRLSSSAQGISNLKGWVVGGRGGEVLLCRSRTLPRCNQCHPVSHPFPLSLLLKVNKILTPHISHTLKDFLFMRHRQPISSDTGTMYQVKVSFLTISRVGSPSTLYISRWLCLSPAISAGGRQQTVAPQTQGSGGAICNSFGLCWKTAL